jgi:hypothetical protein
VGQPLSSSPSVVVGVSVVTVAIVGGVEGAIVVVLLAIINVGTIIGIAIIDCWGHQLLSFLWCCVWNMHTALNFVKYCQQKKLAKSVHTKN